MAFVTFAMMVDFCFFREQMCLIACPYGRFQSVLLDQNSLIVAYDKNRGEPRGKKARASTGLPVLGDCIDCGNCVTTCPTGIDIRDGLQMECINCTQCIDACDAVMKKNWPIAEFDSVQFASSRCGLVCRHASRANHHLSNVALRNHYRICDRLSIQQILDAVLLREPGNPYVMTEDGNVRNVLKLKSRIAVTKQWNSKPNL